MQRVAVLVVGLTLLAAPFGMMARQSATGGTSLSSEEEEASYKIYSTVLKAKEPLVVDWTIVRETRAVNMCLEPTRDQQLIYRPIIDDYAFKNRKLLAQKQSARVRSPLNPTAERTANVLF
jgi:hypothetical protein